MVFEPAFSLLRPSLWAFLLNKVLTRLEVILCGWSVILYWTKFCIIIYFYFIHFSARQVDLAGGVPTKLDVSSDANPSVPTQPTTRWVADPIRMKIGSITSAQTKRFRDNLAAFIQGVIHFQEDLSIPKDLRPVLGIQVVEVDMDPGSNFGEFMKSWKQEMIPTLWIQ
ncbi:uncharacterized protein LOC125424315 [Ziziphus jujuba]|uniref:Uncharacterized protein LOC125424315 n=1 Tax=Ziziphus jujuba TaxID=326968 RepID=A0ABM3IXC0_ZIZJJ|nr:uncharacterized protein LOC125424315 [Ziziphus jujuba]